MKDNSDSPDAAGSRTTGAFRLEFVGASYVRDGKAIIDSISLDLTEQRVGVIGLNGSGKTTFARLACGLIEPTSGQVLLNGTNVSSNRKAAVKLVSIVFQNPDHQIIFPTVQEEIAFGLIQSGIPKPEAMQITLAILDEFGRADWAERAIHNMSQGQRHLVCIMAAMAMRPALLVLDEPFTGPDLPTVRQLHRQLDKLNVGQLLITHDLQYLKGFDRVIWLDRGYVRLNGPASSVLSAFSQEIDNLDGLDAFTDFPDQDDLPPHSRSS